MIAVLLLALAEVATLAVPAPAGDWIVDLTSKPGDSPYRQPMRLELKPDGAVPYHTAACQTGGDGHRADLGRAPEFPVELDYGAGGVAVRRQD
ncbi:hypothetical protein [uncultured Sphingomonas sp.]|uniref:hypothetical protein n=1 Tax=uncultured Sphingomonas sp. TaxID=158754 RepID=UPI00374A4996